MLQHIYLNGEYVSRDGAGLHPADLSILRGYGVFDYFRYAKGKPRFVDDHIRRFEQSAAGLGLALPIAAEHLKEVVYQLIERNGDGEGGIRFVLTGGYAGDSYTPVRPNLLALPYAFQSPPDEMYRRGCKVMLHAYERQLPRLKTIDYIEGIRIQPMLKRIGAQYPLYVDREGNIRESDRSNFMVVRDGVLITPVDSILLGITRLHILRLARSLGIPVEERAVSVSELLEADEALICSSVKGAMPITRVDDRAIGLGGDAGAITRTVMQSWTEYIQ